MVELLAYLVVVMVALSILRMVVQIQLYLNSMMGTFFTPVAVALAVSDQILGSQGVSRVHGGGFAGTIQAFVRREMADKYRETMDQILGPGSCRIFRIRKYGCLRML